MRFGVLMVYVYFEGNFHFKKKRSPYLLFIHWLFPLLKSEESTVLELGVGNRSGPAESTMTFPKARLD